MTEKDRTYKERKIVFVWFLVRVEYFWINTQLKQKKSNQGMQKITELDRYRSE